ncbi:MAG: hypothetical protein K2I26_00610 [Paramuribaculum sp.]|nr:hypothetical protein [Paramuribaculum sp.]
MKTFKEFIQPARSWANYAFFRRYRYARTIRRHFRQYYSPDAPLSAFPERSVICMADGKCHHGGLADRLRSFVTYYSYCKEHGRRFGIHSVFPFPLEDYLVPNLYDWRLRPGELTFNSTQARAFYMDNTSEKDQRERDFQRKLSERYLSDETHIQHHVYSSFFYAEADFGRYFHELFRPAPRIAALLEKEREALGGNYISVSARFLELLGDFKEPKATRHLTPQEQTDLIRRCVGQIEKLHALHPDHRILVTSDSRRFIQACAQLPYVHSTAGEISHVDVKGANDHAKTFLDFLLIADAAHVYQIRTAPMYGGNFSLRAAQAGNRPHNLISF